MPKTKSGKTTSKKAAATTHKTRTKRAHRTGHTVRAAAANTSERISGAAQDTARMGQNAAADGTQRMADQVTQMFGLSGERNAYRSVLSAVGSCEMSGASRWLEAVAVPGPSPRVATTTPSTAATAATSRPSASFLTCVSLSLAA